MKFRVISDVHLDFSMYSLPYLETDKENTLLVCGDIGTGNRVFRTVEWLANLADRFLNVCFCLGNHDYWGNSIDGTKCDFNSYIRMMGRPNLHFLDDSWVDIGEFIIFGGTMWTDVPPYAEIYEKNMGDWHYIEKDDQGFKFGASQQTEEHRKYKEKLQQLLDSTKKNVIVMSHHAPVCTRDHFPHRSNLDVYYFCSDMVDLVGHERLKMWCHGHTHDAVDTMCMNTNIVCNPRGYESKHHSERTGYDSEKIWRVMNENYS